MLETGSFSSRSPDFFACPATSLNLWASLKRPPMVQRVSFRSDRITCSDGYHFFSLNARGLRLLKVTKQS